MKRAKTTVLLLLLLSSCLPGPRYRRPSVSMTKEWPEAEGITRQTGDLQGWWKLFGDPQLDQLVACALENSPDMAVACARIRQARASRRVAASPFYPQIDGAFGASRQRESPNLIVGGFPTGLGVSSFDTYQLGFDAIWELDIFGRNRRAFQAASAEVCASIANAGDVMVTLTAEVARNYTDVRCFQRRIEVAGNNLASQKNAVEVSSARFEAGLTSQLDVAQAQTIYSTTRSLIPLLEEGLYQSMHRLAILLGFEPDYLYNELHEVKPMPLPPGEIPAGLPCQLIRRRPDIRAAEWQLVAANAEVGRAIAELYPRINLLGTIGLAADSPHQMPMFSSRLWSLGGQILQPIFQGWRLRAQVQFRGAFFEERAALFEQTVLEALEEVRNAMVSYEKERERFAALLAAVAASRRSLELSSELYTYGLVDFLNVVEAERGVLLLEDDLIVSQRDFIDNAIALYKALGGGWAQE
jgi:outer membrane protein, multidrug efflux system